MQGTAKRILFSVDSKWRDLPSYVLLKGIIERKYGHKVFIVPMGSEPYYVPFLKPDIVIFNHLLEKQKGDLAEELKSKNILIGILPTEGAPISKKSMEVVAGIYHDYKCVDIHFTWNLYMKEFMLQHNVLSEDKLKVIGVPRFDFYRPPGSSALMPKEHLLGKYGLDIKSPVVTLATNFISAKFVESSVSYLSKDAENLRISDAVDMQERIEWCKKEFASRSEALSIFHRLAESLPDTNFLLKHHPMEDVKFYSDLGDNLRQKGIRNVAVISQEHIWDVLGSTDLLMQRSCTTATEAWMLNLPTIQLHLSDHYYSADHLQGNEIAASYEEALRIIKEYLEGKEIPAAILSSREMTLEKMFYKIDGQSSGRCAMYLDEFLANTKTRTAGEPTLKDIFRLIVYSAKIFARNMLYSLPDLFSSLHNKAGNIDKRVRRRDIRAWERRLSAVVDRYIG